MVTCERKMNAFEAKFMSKINRFMGYENFEWLERKAQKALDLHCGFGYQAIAARVFMRHIIESPAKDILKLLNENT
ncbi:hypothetical protein [Enterococcus sp. BWR-S5]|uniref:hypothetical protein n=1 Tax=Enterococcus sp. BWR-S5 TaxID=2787714 RepID=UPI001920D26B|nr:hypothetical protein [Enterococcus sp. BWR-S5]MBL1227276.1 hypothetical protein [Enterococcus sp. BWR-S5]